jgi:ATP-dependent exoDNAse (exonuclease V) beta subunit
MSKRKPTIPNLPFDEPPLDGAVLEGAAFLEPSLERPLLADAADRAAAVDPRRNVVLEASAGTGKTRVLVDRYVNLVRAGVEPRNILAITFTRKAASEMRERILTTLRRAAEEGGIQPAAWRSLRDHLQDVAISTIDAFCLSLLREFPLEADLDPGFGMADETEALRLVDESLDRTLRICRAAALTDPATALVLARLGEWQLREGLRGLIDRRLVAAAILARAVRPIPDALTPARAAQRFIERLRATLGGRLNVFIASGPLHASRFRVLATDLRRLLGSASVDDERAFWMARLLMDGLSEYFLTREGTPRKRSAFLKDDFPDERARRAHLELSTSVATAIVDDFKAFRRDVNAVLTRGVWNVFAIATKEYRRTLDQHAVVDFPEALARALDLLGAMGDFTESRFLLESRYHHLLVDEFQDTSEAQWRLVWQLVQSWREGRGLADDLPLEPTIFVVGDRKQSIYGFRDADVGVLLRAAGHVGELRPGQGEVRRAIRRSFRAVPSLLAFTNSLFGVVEKLPDRADAFTYDDKDRFPVDDAEDAAGEPALGIIAAPDSDASAQAVAAEVARLLEHGTVRDRQTGVVRRPRPGDVGILFRTREGHQEFERALEARGIRSYVYKGLGFFDADEIKDVIALLRYLADPSSDLRVASFLRSRFVRLSDRALAALAPQLARTVLDEAADLSALDADDCAVLARVRATVPMWLALADRVPPAELLDTILRESAYFWELAGPRADQARENLKKIRGVVRRIQNRGYATLARVTDHLDRLSAGDESNAAIDAVDAVNLMTVHAAKGLEFPIVFIVNLGKGAGGSRAPIRFSTGGPEGPPSTSCAGEDAPVVSIGDFRSEADEDAAAREREEVKRLLYVAVTRARDRLYFASTLNDGVFVAGRLGLGDVLPPDFRDLFQRAMASQGQIIEWIVGDSPQTMRGSGTVPNGTACVHRFRVCPVPEAVVAVRPPDQKLPAHPILHDFCRLGTPSVISRRASDQGVASTTADTPIGGDDTIRSNARIVGSLVHRLLERQPVDPSRTVILDLAASLLRADERVQQTELPSLVNAAVDRYLALVARPDISALLSGGRRWHEVPVTIVSDGLRTRGSIDTLILLDPREGSVPGAIVLEFKTGARAPWHQRQLDQYVKAAKALLPGANVEGILVYSEGSTAVQPDFSRAGVWPH